MVLPVFCWHLLSLIAAVPADFAVSAVCQCLLGSCLRTIDVRHSGCSTTGLVPCIALAVQLGTGSGPALPLRFAGVTHCHWQQNPLSHGSTCSHPWPQTVQLVLLPASYHSAHTSCPSHDSSAFHAWLATARVSACAGLHAVLLTAQCAEGVWPFYTLLRARICEYE